ncbi:riboflavin biosynthesis protein RibT [Fructilactobacillus vespulae]|uniref:riboflavin biosynthesis protein RibT n=1 Tax=Fructilactobacillus vespulae TaxID=1249630 RepID=UPI0039B633C4
MLYKYQTDYEKVVLGILSLSNSHNNIEFLKQEIDWYNSANNRILYVWKDEFNNWAGVLGVEEKNNYVLIRRVTLTPDVNTVFNIFRVLDNLNQIYSNDQIIGTLETRDIIGKWERNNEQQRNKNSYK